MSRKITFKNIFDACEDDEYLINYLNSFKGENVYQKFLNILKKWEQDVSYNIGFNIDNKDIKISLKYFISEIENYEDSDVEIEIDNTKFTLNVPNNFSNNHDFFDINKYVKKIQVNSLEIVGNDKCFHVLEHFPPTVYNNLVKEILKIKEKTIIFTNPNLRGMVVNFFTNTPLQILKNLFSSYDRNYFRDVIYVLSKKIDGRILMDSTMMDIEYYIEKMSNDNSDPIVPNLA